MLQCRAIVSRLTKYTVSVTDPQASLGPVQTHTMEKLVEIDSTCVPLQACHCVVIMGDVASVWQSHKCQCHYYSHIPLPQDSHHIDMHGPICYTDLEYITSLNNCTSWPTLSMPPLWNADVVCQTRVTSALSNCPRVRAAPPFARLTWKYLPVTGLWRYQGTGFNWRGMTYPRDHYRLLSCLDPHVNIAFIDLTIPEAHFIVFLQQIEHSLYNNIAGVWW